MKALIILGCLALCEAAFCNLPTELNALEAQNGRRGFYLNPNSMDILLIQKFYVYDDLGEYYRSVVYLNQFGVLRIVQERAELNQEVFWFIEERRLQVVVFDQVDQNEIVIHHTRPRPERL